MRDLEGPGSRRKVGKFGGEFGGAGDPSHPHLSHPHRGAPGAAGLRLQPSAARDPQGPELLLPRGRGPKPPRPQTLWLALLQRHQEGLHFLRGALRWPVLGLGLGQRPPGARERPSLQRRDKGEGAREGVRGWGRLPAEGPRGQAGCGRTPRHGDPGLRRSRPCVSRGRIPAKRRLVRRARKEKTEGRNEARSHEEPTRDRKSPATGNSPQLQEKCGRHRNAY